VCLDMLKVSGMVVFDTEKHSNVKRRAEYRRIKKNYKTLEKYKQEKLRRGQILELQDQGLHIKEIVLRLGVSESTIKRDLSKMRHYIKGQSNLVARSQSMQSLSEFQSLSLKKQLDFVRELVERERVVRRVRRCSALVVTVDFDAALEGRYALKFKPRLPVDMVEDSRITVEVQICGRRQILGRIYMGRIVHGTANLQTNQSVNVLLKNVLQGLQVVDSASSAS
jgi:DNA-binding CsgD family transcriptional regulator